MRCIVTCNRLYLSTGRQCVCQALSQWQCSDSARATHRHPAPVVPIPTHYNAAFSHCCIPYIHTLLHNNNNDDLMAFTLGAIQVLRNADGGGGV